MFYFRFDKPKGFFSFSVSHCFAYSGQSHISFVYNNIKIRRLANSFAACPQCKRNWFAHFYDYFTFFELLSILFLCKKTEVVNEYGWTDGMTSDSAINKWKTSKMSILYESQHETCTALLALNLSFQSFQRWSQKIIPTEIAYWKVCIFQTPIEFSYMKDSPSQWRWLGKNSFMYPIGRAILWTQ